MEEGIAAGGVRDVNIALQEVLKTTLIHNGLACRICEATKAETSIKPISACLHPTVMSLCQVGGGPCAKRQVNLIKADDSKKLGEW